MNPAPAQHPPTTADLADVPTITVVIPVRDDAPALRRCLESLVAQHHSPEQIIVVDNGSSDDSAAVARSFGALVVAQAQVGIPAAAATGYDAVRTDLIARCDADSLPSPEWLARIVDAFRADPSLQALTGTGRFYDLPAGFAALASKLYLGAYYLLVHAALGHTALWGSNMALRRGAWLAVREQVHRHDQEVHDDMDLAFALGPAPRIRHDRGLSVGMSARSLRGGKQVARRVRRAINTLTLNWARMPPWQRWHARLRR